MRKVLEQCPNCGGELEITRLTCTECDTTILSRYRQCRFCRLPAESVEFLEHFVRSRGNVKEMERETGESYWAIRRRLDEVIAEMGMEAPSEDDLSTSRQEILARLSRGEINVQEATRLLSQLKGDHS